MFNLNRYYNVFKFAKGYTLYILRKAEKPILEIAEIVSTTQPTMFVPNAYGKSLMTISAKVGEQVYNFEGIDASLAIVNDGNGTTIAESRELMQGEVENLLNASQQVLKDIGYHKQVVNECKAILQDLNPAIKQEQERENRLASLESKIEQILKALNSETKK